MPEADQLDHDTPEDEDSSDDENNDQNSQQDDDDDDNSQNRRRERKNKEKEGEKGKSGESKPSQGPKGPSSAAPKPPMGGAGGLGGGAGAGGAAGGAGAGGAGALGGGAASGGSAAVGGAAAASSPVLLIVLIVVGILILIIIIIVMMAGAGGASQNQTSDLKITKAGPTEAQIGDELLYQITVIYPKQATDIVITDNIPDGTEYISSDQKTTCDNGECNTTSKVVTWNLKDILPVQNGAISNANTILVLKLRATANNSFLVNRAEGTVTPYVPRPDTGGGPPAEGFVPAAPHTTDCSGKYNFSKWPDQNPLGNFGDPQCNFSKDNLYKHLQTKESNPEFVNIWFNMVVPVESGYSPDAFAPPVGVQCSLDCAGAWGLYQMGSSSPPGQAPPAPGKNGPLDRGDVNWEVQTTMAINYNRELLKCNFRYWQSAMKVWGQYSC